MNQTQTVKNRVTNVSTATALSSNTDRLGFAIQNVGTPAMYVKLGSGCSSSDYDFILQAGSAANDGKGGFFTMNASVVYTGIITTASASAGGYNYTAWEV